MKQSHPLKALAIRPSKIYMAYAVTQVALQVALAVQLWQFTKDLNEKLVDFGGIEDLGWMNSPIIILITFLIGFVYISLQNRRQFERLYDSEEGYEEDKVNLCCC